MSLDGLLARLERLEREATPGPWRVQGHDEEEQSWCILGGGPVLSSDEHAVAFTPDYSRDPRHNAALIAEARNALPALLAVARAAERLRGGAVGDGRTGTVSVRHDFYVALVAALAALEEPS